MPVRVLLPEGGTQESVRSCALGGDEQLRDSKVEQLQVPVTRDEDVLRLEVAVGNAALVRRGDALGHLCRPLEGQGQGHGSLRQPLPQCLALQQLGDEVRLVLVKAHVVEGDHVRMVHGGGELRLALKPVEEGDVSAERFGHDLDGHVAAQARVLRPVHLGHAPPTRGGKPPRKGRPEFPASVAPGHPTLPQRAAGVRLCCVTASVSAWRQPWARRQR